jgi:hypothetical protein
LDFEILITLDIDWVPDWIIEDVAIRLREAGVKSTWFATHQCRAIDQLVQDPLFEVGLHPNFLSGSSHGKTPDQVLSTMRRWFPTARAVRTHSLFQSEPLLELMVNRHKLDIDCSIHLPQVANITPHQLRFTEDGRELIRIPHVFQDNMYMMRKDAWDASLDWIKTPGLKVFNFHPIHIVLNSVDFKPYTILKNQKDLAEVTRDDFEFIDRDKRGTGDFFDMILGLAASQPTRTISEYASAWAATQIRSTP